MSNTDGDREPITFLVIEDDDDHANLISMTLTDSHPGDHIVHLKDGREALAYLQGQTPHQDAARPGLVLLDLNLPMVSGLEVLNYIKTDPGLCTIPVVVLSTSAADSDLSRAYTAHANSYLVKPMGYKNFSDLIRQVASYWSGLNMSSPAA